MVRELYLLKKNYASKIINIGNGLGVSNLQIIRVLKKKLKHKIQVLFTKRRLGDCAKLICNINKAKKNLNWKPQNSKIEKIIIDEINWSKYLLKKNSKDLKISMRLNNNFDQNSNYLGVFIYILITKNKL